MTAGITPAAASDRFGLLVMAYGTASGPDDIERYYTDIRGGRPPAAHHLRDLTERYAAIGNRFPLLGITERQAAALERTLNHDGRADRPRFRAYLGMKHSPPFIAEAVDRMRRDGIRRAVGIVMAPHWSGMSIETYIERVEAAVAQRGGPDFSFVRSFHDDPRFVAFLADRVAEALAKLPDATRERATVIFSAHSLPVRSSEDGRQWCKYCTRCETACRYPLGLRETADLVAARVGLGPEAYTTGWQSAGRTADPWFGPPVEEVIRAAATQGRSAAVVCSAGFVADHLEILYDLDIEARHVAEEAGIAFARTRMPNDDPAFIGALAGVIGDHLAVLPRS
jgi:ferrochelatase